MAIQKTSFYNNAFIGLYCRANDSVALIPRNSSPEFEALVSKALEVPAKRVYVDESGLLGVFSALNNKGCILPHFASDADVSNIKRDTGLNVARLEDALSPGTNILANDSAALLNPLMGREDAKIIRDCLGVETFQQPQANATVGAMNLVTNRGLLAYNDTPDVVLKFLDKIFKVKGAVGSVNFGSTANGFGLVANGKGALVGERTSGVEMQRVYEGLFG